VVLDAVGAALPAALGIASSPIPIVAVVLVLATPRATVNGTAFAAAWVLGLAAATTVVLWLTGTAAEDGGSDARGAVQVVVGVALLLLAARTWLRRPAADDVRDMPAWMARLDAFPPRRMVVLGLLLSAANPKNLALVLAGVESIQDRDLDDTDQVVAAVIFVALASSTVLVAVLAHVVAPERSARVLGRVKQFMIDHKAAITVVILVLLGLRFLYDGVTELG